MARKLNTNTPGPSVQDMKGKYKGAYMRGHFISFQ